MGEGFGQIYADFFLHMLKRYKIKSSTNLFYKEDLRIFERCTCSTDFNHVIEINRNHLKSLLTNFF